jgi:hypothetical protein
MYFIYFTCFPASLTLRLGVAGVSSKGTENGQQATVPTFLNVDWDRDVVFRRAWHLEKHICLKWALNPQLKFHPYSLLPVPSS